MTISIITYGMFFAVATLLIWAAISDIRSFEIPNWISATIIGLYAAYVIVRNVVYPEFGAIAWLPAIGAAALVLFVFTVLFARGMIGGGDVKLLTAVTLWVGFSMLVNLLFWTSVGGGFLALFLLIKNKYISPIEGNKAENMRKAEIPYGIAIAFGGILTGFQMVRLGELSLP
jgi:prepilin peptidase CpaA